ncbi:SH3 domain-containing protein [Crucibulum laeve]|uniref:SH3 domain-containing protein n=1 Tax=Crucibulum laeve TaxID=68775 RepID=A0A5C3M5N2_9AGAR|nr:SH3 domain-containing protein [Crucibulum laeve]
MSDSSALIAYILSQTKQNVEFLLKQNKLPEEDGRLILSKLDAAALPAQAANLQLTPNKALDVKSTTQTDVVVRSAQPPPPSTLPQTAVLFQARAVWSYNELGQEPNDLSFREGEIVEVTAEINNDWWSGRCNGQEGLFPSNYVERLTTRAPPPPPRHLTNENMAPTPNPPPPFPVTPNYPSPYQHNRYSGPVPQQGPYPPYQSSFVQPPQPPYAVTQSAPPVPPSAEEQNAVKKHRFGGKLGNTLAHSAVGGVGFGAGSAVGSGIINSIF